MTSTINASTTAGIVTTADTSGVLALQTAGTTAVTVDASQNVGIGTASPAYKVDITGVERITGNADQQYNFRVQYGSTGFGLYQDDTTGYTRISAYDTTGTTYGKGLTFATATAGSATTERMRIDSSGNVGIGVTNNLTAKLNFDSTDRGETINIYTSSSEASRSGIGKYASETRYYAGTSDIFTWRTGGPSGTERMRIDSSGRVLINATSSSTNEKLLVTNSDICASLVGTAGSNITTLRIQRATNDGDAITFFYGTTQKGYITVASTGTTYNTLSDYRLKENVQPMVGALAKVSALKPVTYGWKDIGKTGQGFIAHELKAIVPECVTGEKDELDDDGNPRYQGIDTSFLVATLTAAIQEQQALITQLQADVAALKGATP